MTIKSPNFPPFCFLIYSDHIYGEQPLICTAGRNFAYYTQCKQDIPSCKKINALRRNFMLEGKRWKGTRTLRLEGTCTWNCPVSLRMSIKFFAIQFFDASQLPRGGKCIQMMKWEQFEFSANPICTFVWKTKNPPQLFVRLCKGW